MSNQSKAKPFPAGGSTVMKAPAVGAYTSKPDTPQAAPMPNVAGYPQKDIKTTGIKMRGTGAATKGKMSRGPMG